VTKKISHSEYIERVKSINPEIEVVGTYDGSDTSIKHKCLKIDCGHEWETTPSQIKRGRGCHKCGKKKIGSNSQISHSDYIASIQGRNIDVLENYSGSTTKIKHLCLTENCGHIWTVTPSHVKSGTGCPKCAKKPKMSHSEYINIVKDKGIDVIEKYIGLHKKIKHKCLVKGCEHVWNARPANIQRGSGCPICARKSMTGRCVITTNEYSESISNRNIEVLDEYQGSSTKINHLCLVSGCGYVWKASPSNIKKGSGCPKCAGVVKITRKMYLENIAHKKIDLVDEFIDASTEVMHRCLIESCNDTWKTKPKNIIGGSGCPKCAGTKKLTQTEYIRSLQQRNIKVVGNYINAKTKIEHSCLVEECSTSWLASPNNIRRGHGCPTCGSNKNHDNLRFSQSMYIERLTKREIEVIGCYVNNSTKINHKCLVGSCGHIWSAAPSNILAGKGCSKCGGREFDLLYIWQDNHNNWKIGVSKIIKGEERIHTCAQKRGTVARNIRMVTIQKAERYEYELLNMFTLAPYTIDSGDGWTEFRTLTKQEEIKLHKYLDKLEFNNS